MNSNRKSLKSSFACPFTGEQVFYSDDTDPDNIIEARREKLKVKPLRRGRVRTEFSSPEQGA